MTKIVKIPWDVIFKSKHTGTKKKIPVYAETKWEAIERVYSQFQEDQPDRKAYEAKKLRV